MSDNFDSPIEVGFCGAVPDDYADPLAALDRLERVSRYLRGQFHIRLRRNEAQALCDAQVMVLRLRMAVLREAEMLWGILDAG
jgi:hypothetical protein